MRTVNVILGADLRSGHNGLTQQAKTKQIDLRKLSTGEAVVFINAKKNKMKCFSYNGVLSYVRFDDPRRGIDLNAIDFFPKAFHPDGRMDYPKALRMALERRMNVKKYKEVEVL